VSAIRVLIRWIKRSRTHVASLVACSSILIGALWAAPPASATQEWPTIPDPVPVELDAATTAYLVLDMVEAVCAPRPACMATVPGVANLLAKAREAGALVVWTTGRTASPPVAGLEQRPDEPTVGAPADKFFGTNLDEILGSHGIRTLVIIGVAANGAPMYTTFGASVRGYTTVVAEDAISADDQFAVFLARYQLLNQPGFDNRENAPLVEGRTTLSRTDLIAFSR
jgi:nicotinamidase-related amidase